MKVKMWGVRGSIPSPGPRSVRYGGNTTCIEVRSDDAELRAALAALVHRPTWLAVHAERAVSRGLGGSCSTPLAAHARWQHDVLQLDAALGHVADPTQPLLTVHVSGAAADDAQAEALGTRAVAALHAAGARDYLSGA